MPARTWFLCQGAHTLRKRIQICLLIISLSLAVNLGISQCKLQPQKAPPSETHARQIIGLQGIKHNEDGQLKWQSAEIEFDGAHNTAKIPLSSIEDVFVGTETTEFGGTVGEVVEGASMAAPYDSGAVLPLLLRQKVDVLTIAFRDSDGGLHAAIFATPKSQATQIRTDLIARGAHASMPKSSPPPSSSGGTPPDATQVPPSASPILAANRNHTSVPAIQIEPIVPRNVQIPDEFRMAIYENLIERLTKASIFPHVYRSGDHRAEQLDDLLTLRTTIDKFNQGNQMERRLTGVLGATKIKVHATIYNRASEQVQAVSVEGKVRIFGENLGVTSDVSKRITKALRKSSF